MNVFTKTALALFAIPFILVLISSGTTTTTPKKNDSILMFQVIQRQVVVDRSMIESAKILSPVRSSDSYGLQIKLKNTAANELARITSENIGKQMNIVLNDVVISSPTIQGRLVAEFQLFDLTREQAEQFIKGLAL